MITKRLQKRSNIILAVFAIWLSMAGFIDKTHAVEGVLPEYSVAESAVGSAGAGNVAELVQILSPLTMFLNADWVVKAVIVTLLLLSFGSWVIFLAKILELQAVRRQAHKDLRQLAKALNFKTAWQNYSDESVSENNGSKNIAFRHSMFGKTAGETAAAQLLLASAAEFQASHLSGMKPPAAGVQGIKERVASVLNSGIACLRRRALRGIGVLATIGSVAPFIGLFGTVWGIMNAFIGIAGAQASGLAAVAPGIAEALLATAAGLLAAIPATVMYNVFVRLTAAYQHILAEIAAHISRLVSRDLDFSAVENDGGRSAVPVLQKGRGNEKLA